MFFFLYIAIFYRITRLESIKHYFIIFFNVGHYYSKFQLHCMKTTKNNCANVNIIAKLNPLNVSVPHKLLAQLSKSTVDVIN